MGAAVPLIAGVATKMFVPAVSTGIAGLFGVAAGTLTNVVAGALVGAATSALMGGDPLSGALFGGLGSGIGEIAGGFFGGGEGEAAAATADAATAGAEDSLLSAVDAPSAPVESMGGGVGPPETTAYDAVQTSLSKSGELTLGLESNEFAQGLLPEGNQFASEIAGSADPFKLQAGAAGGGGSLLDTIMSKEVLGDALVGGGKYLAAQGIMEDRVEKQGEEDRKTAEFENQMRWQGVTPEGSGQMLTNAMQNVRGTRAEALARGYSGRYGGIGSVATYKPQYQQGTLFERVS